MNKKMYIYSLLDNNTSEAYDEAVAAACMQGLYNRKYGPEIYILANNSNKPKYWLDTFSKEGEWLCGRERVTVAGIDELFALTGECVQSAIIWDTSVPATLNVATTIAGIENGIVMSKDFADKYLEKWGLHVLHNLIGKFDGSVTCSKKNDVYLWAIENYLSTGKCSNHLICLFEDSYNCREKGKIDYVITRDWAVHNNAFVYDLSPWGDVTPADDLAQPVGTDLKTYKYMLEELLKQTKGENMTEVNGFFSFEKYSNVEGHPYPHEPVPTEWETVFLISPYNCYQNTVASSCYNQSFHSKFKFIPVKQGRPDKDSKLTNKTYICIHMADYDSATPLYEFLPAIWDEKTRGKFPLAWGVNPNLLECYPDIITYLYKTRSDMDYFVGDASAAGYFNPNRIRSEYWDMVVRHNKHFYNLTDMSISPMVLDWDLPTQETLDNFLKFSKDGYSTIIYNFHESIAQVEVPTVKPFVYRDMMVDFMYNGACNWGSAKDGASNIANALLVNDTPDKPGFHYIRVVWVDAGKIADLMVELRQQRPDLDIELVDPYTYFKLHKQFTTKMQENTV